MFEEDVLETIKKYNLIENGDKLVLGVSGGPDSIAMLNCLINIKNSRIIDFSIVVCHINHGLRENAKIDEKYVLDFCEKHNIKCFLLNENIKEIAEKEKRGLEETGRKVRYDFFNKILKETNSNKIATAHNANDNVETIIMNVLRGSGINGLRGIEPQNDIYIRPLIETNREKIEQYCKDENLNPRHDESNENNTYTRNKIRNIAIPYIKRELNPNIINTLTRLSLIAKDDLNYLDIATKNAYNNMVLEEININNLEENVYNFQNSAKIILDLKKFNKENKAIQKRVILYSITRLFVTAQGIERIHVEDMIKLCNNNIGNKYLTPNKNTKIVIKNKKIILERLK